MKPDYDVVIVGGGLVGASLAVALSGRGFRILMIEAYPFRQPGQPSYDDRALALAHASCNILAGIGLWPGVQSGVTPIREIRVSAMGRFGTVRIHADELAVDALGHVVEARLLGQAVVERIAACDDVELCTPARVTAVARHQDHVALEVAAGDECRQFRAGVAVGADGADSRVREALGLRTVRRDYGQTAIIANVTPERDHDGRAYERLTDTGPMALLPHQGRRCGAVMSVPRTDVERLLSLTDAEYLDVLQRRAGYRLGHFQDIGKRSSYPLSLVYTPEAVAGRCVVMGNAAHTIHPVAAQGFNLGLRDVALLAQILIEGRRAGAAVPDQLLDYQQRRRDDQRHIVRLTDSLIDLFALDLPLTGAGTSAVLAVLDRIPRFKRAFARHTMGYGVPPSRLALGEQP